MIQKRRVNTRRFFVFHRNPFLMLLLGHTGLYHKEQSGNRVDEVHVGFVNSAN